MIEKAVLGTPTLYDLWSFYNNILFLINEQFLPWAPSKRCFDHLALIKKWKAAPFGRTHTGAWYVRRRRRNNFSHKYIQPYPTTSSSKLFSTLQLLPAWPPASADKNQRKLHCRPQQQCNELREVHHRDLKQYLEDQRLLSRQSCRSLPGFLCQIWKRTNKVARLDRNAGRKQRTDQTKLNEHRLSLQTLQPGERKDEPSALQKQDESIFVGTGALALRYAAFRFL